MTIQVHRDADGAFTVHKATHAAYPKRTFSLYFKADGTLTDAERTGAYHVARVAMGGPQWKALEARYRYLRYSPEEGSNG